MAKICGASCDEYLFNATDFLTAVAVRIRVRPECDQDTCLVIVVVDGILEFSFELGSGPAQIQTRADTRVDDGKRHHVILRRQASDGSIELDSITEFGESQGILKMLNTRGNIYIGKC